MGAYRATVPTNLEMIGAAVEAAGVEAVDGEVVEAAGVEAAGAEAAVGRRCPKAAAR
jgi:hypothetical protein